MSIFNLLHLEPMLHTLASVWTLAGELLTAGALLWCLNALARFIRLVYEAGRWTGWLWRTYLVPALLYLADSISWGVAQVDWLEVRRSLKLFLVHGAAVSVMAVRALRQFGVHSAAVTVMAVRSARKYAVGTAVIVVLTAQLLWTYAIRSAEMTVRGVRYTVRGVCSAYYWYERHYIDVQGVSGTLVIHSDSELAQTALVQKGLAGTQEDSLHRNTDSPVRTVIRRTEGGRDIERSIDRNERPKRPSLKRRRHGKLIPVA